MVVFYAVTLMPSTVDKYDSIPATKPKREKKKKQSHHWQTQHIVIINNAINDTKVFFVCVLVWQISWNLCFYRVQAFSYVSISHALSHVHPYYSAILFPFMISQKKRKFTIIDNFPGVFHSESYAFESWQQKVIEKLAEPPMQLNRNKTQHNKPNWTRIIMAANAFGKNF